MAIIASLLEVSHKGPPTSPAALGPPVCFIVGSAQLWHYNPHPNLEAQSQRASLSMERQEASLRMQLTPDPSAGLPIRPQHCPAAPAPSTGSRLQQSWLLSSTEEASPLKQLKSFFQTILLNNFSDTLQSGTGSTNL